MCSVGDDEENGKLSKLMPEKSRFNIKESKCLKCRLAEPVVVLQGKYPYCKECFIAATTHKFKALLGKNRIIHVDDKVLIWHRTGHPSTALLHFLRSGLDLTTPKRIRFIPIILFIEDHFNLLLQERKRILSDIDEEVKRFKFPIYYASLAEYAHDRISPKIFQDVEEINITENDRHLIKKCFQKQTTKTKEKELLKILRYDLLIDAAKQLGCSTIFVPDLGIDIASQFMTSISVGRGAHTVYDIGTVDGRDDKVNILRPLRTFTIKELAFYNHLHNLQPVTFLIPEENPYSCIQNLVTKFVLDLQENYPATVSTVVRTGDKLSIDKTFQNNEKCLLCKVPIENKFISLQSTEATNFSHWISTQGSNYKIPIEERAEQLIDDFSNNFETRYCFACSRIAEFML